MPQWQREWFRASPHQWACGQTAGCFGATLWSTSYRLFLCFSQINSFIKLCQRVSVLHSRKNNGGLDIQIHEALLFSRSVRQWNAVMANDTMRWKEIGGIHVLEKAVAVLYDASLIIISGNQAIRSTLTFPQAVNQILVYFLLPNNKTPGFSCHNFLGNQTWSWRRRYFSSKHLVPNSREKSSSNFGA